MIRVKRSLKNPLDLAIDQVVDLKLVETVCLFQLPRAGPAHHYLWSILLNYRVGDDLQELMRVKGVRFSPKILA
jgi:hypothetical protein